jgi:hypothetical protein
MGWYCEKTRLISDGLRKFSTSTPEQNYAKLNEPKNAETCKRTISVDNYARQGSCPIPFELISTCKRPSLQTSEVRGDSDLSEKSPMSQCAQAKTHVWILALSWSHSSQLIQEVCFFTVRWLTRLWWDSFRWLSFVSGLTPNRDAHRYTGLTFDASEAHIPLCALKNRCIVWWISTWASPVWWECAELLYINYLSSDVASITFTYFLNSAHPSLKYGIQSLLIKTP